MTEPAGQSSSQRGWLLVCIAVFLLFAGAKAYADRYSLNPDAISYLDMADRLLEGHADPLFHSYWSPLYPVTLAAGLKIAGSSADSEFPVLHLVNWFIFVGIACAFAYLLTRLWDNLSTDEPPLQRDPWFFRIWAAFCFALLWDYGSQFLALSRGNPDGLVAGVAFLAAGLACVIWSRKGSLTTAVLLGLVLGAGYYAKAAMLPIGIFLLLCLALRNWRWVAVSAIVLALVAAPLVLAISRAEHHLTLGEAGRLNYAWSINDVPPHSGWTGVDPSNGAPVHAPRVIVAKPKTLEFASPVIGTHPLWYDPAYWYEGANSHFNPRGQLKALVHDAGFFSDLFTYSLLALTVLVVLLLHRASGFQLRILKDRFPFLLFWPALVIALYAVVALETRYVAPFLVLAFLGCLQMLLSRRGRGLQKAVLLTATLLIVVPSAKEALKAASPVRRAHAQAEGYGDVEAAHQLQQLGLKAGDMIGAIDTGFDFFFAHLAGLRITTAVYEPDTFWSLDEAGQRAVLQAMGQVGVKAVVAAKPASACAGSNLWHPLGNSGYIAYLPVP